PVQEILRTVPSLESQGSRPLALTFEDRMKALTFFHIEEHTSGRHLLQVLNEDDFAAEVTAPAGGIRTSTFFETLNTRGLEQLLFVYSSLQPYAAGLLPAAYSNMGNLTAIGGSLTDAVLSVCRADYRKGSRKAKIHLGFDISRSVPSAFFLTDGKSGERPFVSQILSPGQTGVMDRGYQSHRLSDLLQTEGKNFVCRIKSDTKKTVICENSVLPDSIVFYDASRVQKLSATVFLLFSVQKNRCAQFLHSGTRLSCFDCDRKFMAVYRKEHLAEKFREPWEFLLSEKLVWKSRGLSFFTLAG
ncbi:MAG: transposase, partial [Desulfobacterales bacterium]|nr:transposase [Desulfobacterales bacterium]